MTASEWIAIAGIVVGLFISGIGWIFTLGRQREAAERTRLDLLTLRDENEALSVKYLALEKAQASAASQAEKLKMLQARLIEVEQHSTDAARHRDPQRDEQRFADLRDELKDIRSELRNMTALLMKLQKEAV